MRKWPEPGTDSLKASTSLSREVWDVFCYSWRADRESTGERRDEEGQRGDQGSIVDGKRKFTPRTSSMIWCYITGGVNVVQRG